jgi:hypothetical protein
MSHGWIDVGGPDCGLLSTPAVIDAAVLQMVLAVLTGWLDRQERQAVAYLIEENRVLRRQLGKRRLQFTEAERRRLAVRRHQLGRQVLRQISARAPPVRR